MSIAFSGGSIQVSSFAATTTSTLIGGIQTALTAAGWSVVSGSGTTNLVMQTATTPQSLAMRFKFHDNAITAGGVATVQISMQTTSGSIVGLDNDVKAPWVRVNGSTNYKIICGPYYFWLLVPGSYTDYGYFAMGGVPWLPSFLSSITQCGYLVTQSNDQNSTDYLSIPHTFRSDVSCSVQNAIPRQQLIVNTNYISTDGNLGMFNSSQCANFLQPWLPAQYEYSGNLAVPGTSNGGANATVVSTFFDGSFATGDPWIAFTTNGSLTAPATGVVVMGMLWDSTFIFDSTQAADATTTFSGHNWYNITNTKAPSLWVATS